MGDDELLAELRAAEREGRIRFLVVLGVLVAMATAQFVGWKLNRADIERLEQRVAPP